MVIVKAFPSGPFDTNAYLAACEKTLEALIIDPAHNSFEMIQEFIQKHKLKPQKILLTHSHWDHIADVKKFKDAYALPVYIHSLDVPNLVNPGADRLHCAIKIPSIQPDVLVDEGMEIDVGELKFQVLHTPGHSPGCVCYYEPQHHILFSGDTLFKGTIGNLSFPTSQPSKMRSSLDKLASLPPETRVYPGHEEETTIADELAWLKDFNI